MNKKKRKKISALILLLAITVGYALLSTTLKINGIANIKNNTWDIHWDDRSISVTEGSVESSIPVVTGNNNDTLSFTASLNLPGDFYEFTVDAVNVGTVDGMIDDIQLKVKDGNTSSQTYGEEIDLEDYIIISVIYADNKKIEKKHLLEKRIDQNTPTREKYKIRIEFDKNTDILPSSDLSYTIEYKVVYKQADATAVPVRSTPAIQMLIDKSTTTTNTLEPVAISHGATEQTAAVTDYRYMGANPNNYILFNCSTDNLSEQNSNTCEKWRIIGIVDGKIKLIREDSIGNKQWGGLEKYYPEHDGNPGYNYNVTEWEDSQLYAYLNGDYYNGLSSSSKNAISESTWYLGDWTHDDTYYNYYSMEKEVIFTEGAYVGERSTNIDDYNSNIKSNGKVGLMYPSDYGYASSVCNSDCIATSSTCGSHVGTYHLTQTNFPSEEYGFDPDLDRDYSSIECKNSNWLYKSIYEFTITPIVYDACIHTISLDGYITSPHSDIYSCLAYDSEFGAEVRPTVYLKTRVVFEGSGTSSNPYKIKNS